MKLNLVLLILFGVIQIFANNLTDHNYYSPENDNSAVMMDQVLKTLNKVLKSNQEMSQQLMDMKNRLNQQDSVCNKLTDGISLNYKTGLVLGPSDGWTVIQRRQDGSVDFYRDWNDYKMGFGNPNGEFFIGLERLHEMTTYGPPQELFIFLEDHNNNTRYAKYDKFQIGDESEKYILKELGKYSGSAGDSLTYHKGRQFTTKDQDNDARLDENCANTCFGGWWYGHCYFSNLNGRYSSGLFWYHWLQINSTMKYVEMKIRNSN